MSDYLEVTQEVSHPTHKSSLGSGLNSGSEYMLWKAEKVEAKSLACTGQFNYCGPLSNEEWSKQGKGLLWDGFADCCLLSTWSNLLRHTIIDWLLHASRGKPFQMHFCWMLPGRGFNKMLQVRMHGRRGACTRVFTRRCTRGNFLISVSQDDQISRGLNCTGQ